jgi:hypothetical protein
MIQMERLPYPAGNDDDEQEHEDPFAVVLVAIAGVIADSG